METVYVPGEGIAVAASFVIACERHGIPPGNGEVYPGFGFHVLFYLEVRILGGIDIGLGYHQVLGRI